MLTMQAFQEWLASPGKTPDARQSRLARLTRVGREQVKSLASDLIWYVWSAPQA
ncbi:MAG: hypothetical protein AB1554_08925 [Chloroflexota bacterium]